MPSHRIAASTAPLLALLLLPGAADAATVAYSGSGQAVTFVAAPGEANRLTISVAAGRLVYAEATGVLIAEAEADCDGNGTSSVSCKLDHLPGSPVFAAGADLDDLADELVVRDLPAIFAEASGGDGADRLDAAAATTAAFLGGEGGNDRLTGGHGANFLDGGADADTMSGGPAGSQTTYSMGSVPDGADVLAGGGGLDIAEYDERTAALGLSADGVANDGQLGENDNIAVSVEAIQGGAAADTIRGSDAVDAQLSGYGGNDQLIGGAGDDVLFGGLGADSLAGNGGDDLAASGDRNAPIAIGGGDFDEGADAFAGGAGFDTIDYSSRPTAVSVTLDGAANDGAAGEGDNIGGDVEELIGGPLGDVLRGNAAAQRIAAGSGPDTIDPGAGADDVRAGDGDDTIAARDATADTIACGVGADAVTGDFNDLLDGCETAALTAAPAPSDTTRPAVTVGVDRTPRFRAVRRGLRVRLDADEVASYTVELLGSATRARISRSFNLRLVRRSVAATADARTIRLRPRRALLGSPRRLTLRLRVIAKDASGNTRTLARTLRVHR